MRMVTGALVMTLSLGAGLAADQGRGNGRGAPAGDRAAVERDASSGTTSQIVFAPRDIDLIRTHYRARYRQLPPGQQKKLARGGTLPPGWQKKMEPFPAPLLRGVVVLPGDHRYGVMDGHAVIYHPITHAILDIVSLF